MQPNHPIPSSNATQPASPMNAEHSHIDDNDDKNTEIDQAATRMPMLKPADRKSVV